jgi:P-loop containing dynein motor region D4
MTKLAAFVSGFDVFQIVRTRKYDERAFKDDLKLLFDLVCVENKKVGPFVTRPAHRSGVSAIFEQMEPLSEVVR